MQQGSNRQEVSPPPVLREQQIFTGLSIDVAVIAAVPYLHSRTTFHLISMTFHQDSPQSPVPGQGRERAVHWITHMRSQTPSTFVGSPWELQPRSISTRLNLTHSAIYLFPGGSDVSHLPSH